MTHTFVFSKARALARRLPVEQDKKAAAHTVCQRLVAMLTLNQSPFPSISGRKQSELSSSQGEPVSGSSLDFSLAGNAQRGETLGCEVLA